jgi:hypothetical protein
MPSHPTSPPMPSKETPNKSVAALPIVLIGAGGAVVVVLGLIFVAAAVFLLGSSDDEPSGFDKNMFDELLAQRAGFESRTADMRQKIDEAHALWESDDRFEAVRRYKSLIRSDEVHWHLLEFRPELVTVYRRVIEHEAEYGDPGSARDWAMRAYDKGQWSEYTSLRKLTFTSDAAAEIWEEVIKANQRME